MKKRRARRSAHKEKRCYDCDHCTYIGDGDHLCDLDNEIIVNDWEPTEEFYHCGGRSFEQK